MEPDSRGPAAIAALLMRHRADLAAYVRAAVRDPHEAEDLLQEVSMAAAASWEEFEPGTNFRAWAREIARRRLLDRAKRSARRPALMEPRVLEALDRAAASRDDAAEPPEREALRLCLEGLQVTSRSVLSLRYAERKGVPRIAQELGRTVQAAYAILKRAREALRECVNRRLGR